MDLSLERRFLESFFVSMAVTLLRRLDRPYDQTVAHPHICCGAVHGIPGIPV
ncbi:hypothetical protein DSOL_4066 [Desulfosporosinus metallidurans]|uniref:Uncharacterized protein n=1 Tax=Desulfosporosinus metallidurans TaxID=1888891 RepID=A0A1Q8QM62_9FIRM|nr:hypothetical protein DSOL_4066 [Desulfosporosinus metallidurans]